MAVTKQNDTTFHQATGLATMALGRNFRRQILGPLGPQWVFYSDAELNTSVVLNHPNDSDMAEDSLVSATFGLTNLTNSRLPGATTQPVVTAEQKTVKGIDLTTAVTQYASPTFATSAGVLYLGLAPDSVVSAANAPAVKPGVDLTHSASFVAAVQRLGVQHFAAFDYCDLPRTAPQAYEYFGPFGVQVRQLMRQFNIQMPTIKLPPIEQLKAHLSPALSVSWADADGVYSRSISPFPLSTHLLGSGQQAMVSAGTASGHCESCKPARVQHFLHPGDDN
jgi:hypothetical protein